MGANIKKLESRMNDVEEDLRGAVSLLMKVTREVDILKHIVVTIDKKTNVLSEAFPDKESKVPEEDPVEDKKEE